MPFYRPYPQTEEDALAQMAEAMGAPVYDGPEANVEDQDVPIPSSTVYPPTQSATPTADAAKSASGDTAQMPANGATQDPASVSNGQALEDDADENPLGALIHGFGSAPAQLTRAAPQLPAPPQAEGIPTWSLVGAGLADLFLNKGRNAGRIISAIGSNDSAVNYENYRRQLEHAKAQSALDNAYAYGGRGKGMTPEQMQLQAIRLGLSQERLGLQQGEAKRKAAESEQKRKQWEELNTVGSDRHKAMVAWAQQNGAPPGIENLPVADIQKIFPAINEYLKNTGDIAQARTSQAAAEAAATGEAAMPSRVATAKGIAEAVQPLELEKIREAERAKTEGQRAAQSGTYIRGFSIDDPTAFQQVAADPTSLRQLRSNVDQFRALISAMDRMEALRAKYGVELQSGEGTEYGASKTLAIGALTQLAASGVLNESEFQRYSKMIPEIELNWTDVAQIAGKDITLDKLRGVKRALEGTVQDKLFSSGGHLDFGSLSTRQQASPPAKPKPAGKKPAPEAAPAGGSKPTGRKWNASDLQDLL